MGLVGVLVTIGLVGVLVTMGLVGVLVTMGLTIIGEDGVLLTTGLVGRGASGLKHIINLPFASVPLLYLESCTCNKPLGHAVFLILIAQFAFFSIPLLVVIVDSPIKTKPIGHLESWGGEIERTGDGGEIGRTGNGGEMGRTGNGGEIGRMGVEGGEMGRTGNGGEIGRMGVEGGEIGRIGKGGETGRGCNGGEVNLLNQYIEPESSKLNSFSYLFILDFKTCIFSFLFLIFFSIE